MVRNVEPQSLHTIISKFKNEYPIAKNKPMISKKTLWDCFLKYTPEDYIIDERNEKIIRTLMRYFRGSEDFNDDGLILSKPDLKKGILIFGDYGIGKTLLFNILNIAGDDLFKNNGFLRMRFKSISSVSFVEDYMKSTKVDNSTFDLKNYQFRPLYIDDLGFEKKAFLSFELLAELLFERNRNKAKTYVTTNKSPKELAERYGSLIGDRLPEMFNIIKWEGESFRE